MSDVVDIFPKSADLEGFGFVVDTQPQCFDNSKEVVGENHVYGLLNVIGKGSYGVVYRAANLTTGETVAVKEEVYGLCGSTLREIEILMALPRHPSIVEFKQVVEGGGGAVFVVMEYLPADLHRFIQQKRKPFTMSELKLVMKQILEGVKFLHQYGVMHRDLKPANILINASKGQLKICDFGLSRLFLPGTSGRCTSGVGTRWYRAPELLQGSEKKISSAIDIWSVGCIMGELVLKEPLFQGKSKADQLRFIYQGLPAGYVHCLKDYLGASGFDLLHKLLAYDPDKRITAEDALDHIWFKEYYGLSV